MQVAHSATSQTYADVVRRRPFEAVLAYQCETMPAVKMKTKQRPIKAHRLDGEYEPDDLHKPVWYEGAASDSTDSGPKRPRGRPPSGAVLDEHGVYVLSPESVEVAVERLKRHREQCRERYRATRDALQAAKPKLFSKNERDGTQQTLRRAECSERNSLSEGSGTEGDQGDSQGR